MVRRRPFKDGTRPPRAKWKQTQLKFLIPRVGFELDHSQYRKKLTELDVSNLKHAIRAHYGNLNKVYFQDALVIAFERANATLDGGFCNKIAELGISNFWDIIMNTVSWYDENCTDPIGQLTAWLVTSHERYNKIHPYERMKHQYGELATEVHKFSESLKKFHGDNEHIMKFYYKCEMWESMPGVSLVTIYHAEEYSWKSERDNWRESKEAREAAEQEAEDEKLANAMADVEMEDVQSVEYYGNGGKHSDATGRYDADSGEYICYRDEHDIYIRVEEEEDEEEGVEEEEEEDGLEVVVDMELDN